MSILGPKLQDTVQTRLRATGSSTLRPNEVGDGMSVGTGMPSSAPSSPNPMARRRRREDAQGPATCRRRQVRGHADAIRRGSGGRSGEGPREGRERRGTGLQRRRRHEILLKSRSLELSDRWRSFVAPSVL